MPKVMNLEQYARATHGTTSADVESHIHAGLRSMPTTKTYKRFFERKLAELQDKRDATTAAYRAALESGEVVAPPKRSLEEIATGEGSAAEAARRVILKREARRKKL